MREEVMQKIEKAYLNFKTNLSLTGGEVELRKSAVTTTIEVTENGKSVNTFCFVHEFNGGEGVEYIWVSGLNLWLYEAAAKQKGELLGFKINFVDPDSEGRFVNFWVEE